MNMRILIGLSLLCVSLLQVQASWAASYSLPAATFPPCSGTWNQSQNSCDGRVIFGVGDSVTASVALTIQAERGFELKGSNTLGSNNHGISLKSTYGSIVVRASGSIFGAIASDSGEVDLTGTQVSGSVTGSGNARFKDSKIGGLVQRNNGISANNTEFQSGIAVSNGSVDLTGGKVQGDIQAANGIKTSLVNINGAINSPNGAVELQGGEVKGNVTGGCCKISLSDLRLTGNIRLTNNDIELDGSEVVGNITTTNRVHLKMSTVWGNVTAASWDAQTIKGTGNSAIYGVCKPSDTTPQKLCQDAPPVAVHHYRLSFATPMLSCQPIPVTVTACADSACSSTVSTSDSITLTPAGAWIGGERKSFAGSDTLTAYLKREAVTRVLGVSGASYACSPANCTLDIKDSGFVFSNLTPIIAGKTQDAVIQAVKKDDESQACVPAFTGGSRTLQFSAAYKKPITGSENVLVNGVILSPGNDESGPGKPVDLKFDNEAKAEVRVLYADAGKVGLSVSYFGAANPSNPSVSEELLNMSDSDSFVSRPAGFCVKSLDLKCDPDEGGEYSKCRSVGEPLEFEISPVAYEEEDSNGLCQGNQTTRNYLQSNLKLTPRLEMPVGGVDGELLLPSTSSYDHQPAAGSGAGWSGTVVQSVAFSEVGVFRLRVEPPPYLDGVMVPASESVPVGRIVPAFLRVEGDIRVQPSCKGSDGVLFSYQDQPMVFESDGPLLTFSAQGRKSDGSVYTTRNYDHEGFWKLGIPAHSYTSVAPEGGGGNRMQVIGSADPLEWLEPNTGDGLRRLRIKGEMLAYRRATVPTDEDRPFRLNAWLLFETAALTDSDEVEVCASEEGIACDRVSFSAGELRLGRVLSENVSAPDVPLAGASAPQVLLPVRIEHWNGTTYGTASDECTVIEEQPDKRIFSGSLSGVKVDAHTPEGFPVTAIQGQGGRLDGSAALRFALHSTVGGVEVPAKWLCIKLPADASVANGGVCGYPDTVAGEVEPVVESGASATFGIYQGPQPLIFRRELYR